MDPQILVVALIVLAAAGYLAARLAATLRGRSSACSTCPKCAAKRAETVSTEALLQSRPPGR